MYLEAAIEQLVGTGRSDRETLKSYDSRFGLWEERSSVRRKPRRTLGPDADVPFFPPELHPVVLHPLVTARGDGVVRRLLVQRLWDYLDFTTELETLAVIPVATKISRGRSGLMLPEQMRADAFKIVTDEAWHAQCSHDFSRQIAQVTNLTPRFDDEPPAFVRRLDEVRAALPEHVRGTEALLFAIVSETLISGILSEIPRDERLPRTVRDLVRDHAEDEGRHHVYFRSVLKHLWPALTPTERRAVGPHVPAVIHAFLEPDYAQTAVHLRGLGFGEADVVRIITESWPQKRINDDIREAARPAIRYFAEAGALDDGATRRAFESAGLIL